MKKKAKKSLAHLANNGRGTRTSIRESNSRNEKRREIEKEKKIHVVSQGVVAAPKSLNLQGRQHDPGERENLMLRKRLGEKGVGAYSVALGGRPLRKIRARFVGKKRRGLASYAAKGTIAMRKTPNADWTR